MYDAILEKKSILLVLLFLTLAAILDSRLDQAECYHSEALKSGHAACEIENHECSGFIQMNLKVSVDVNFARVDLNYQMVIVT